MLARLFNAIPTYFAQLVNRVGTGWNRFWFSPTDPSVACLLRIVCGLCVVGFFVSHTWDLQAWFGLNGILSVETVEQLSPSGSGYRWSFLDYAEGGWTLWAFHALAIATALSFTLGAFTRVTCWLTLLALLSYVHRAPMLTGMLEPLLSFVMLYLCLAPCGARWSFDATRRGEPSGEKPVTSVGATIAVRLIQVHLACFCFMAGATKLAGDTWWLGEAGWWLMARSESRVIDLTGLRSAFLAVNLWTHYVVLFELSFPVLIWWRPLRPLLLSLAFLLWGSLALVTGELSFFVALFVASLAFLDADHLKTLTD